MKLFLAIVLLLVLTQKAESKEFGLGIILGSPTGLSANYLLSGKNSIATALAFDDDDLHFHADYLWRFPNSLHAESVSFGWYAGVGAKFRDHDHNHVGHTDDHDEGKFGPRVVGGLNHDFKKVPIEVFGEISMVMYIIEDTDLDLDFGIGARYYF